MAEPTFVGFGLHLQINNPEAFANAACKMAMLADKKLGMREAKQLYNINNLGACAVLLFSPDATPVGCKIIQCVSEVLS